MTTYEQFIFVVGGTSQLTRSDSNEETLFKIRCLKKNARLGDLSIDLRGPSSVQVSISQLEDNGLYSVSYK